MLTFETLGLSEQALTVVARLGFEKPTPIQAQAIPTILGGDQDLIGQAQTGTGKTAAYGLPILEHLDGPSSTVQVLVLTPTRELAIQVTSDLRALKGEKKLAIAPIYGGAAFGPQLRALKRGVDIVVGTPGRVLDHIRRGFLALDDLQFLVLDEADEMLHMGFRDELEAILDATSSERRTLLFSATMPPDVQRIAERYMGETEVIRVETLAETANLTEHIVYEIREPDRFEALCRVLDMADDFYGIVFCRTRNETSTIAERLAGRGYDVGALNGDFSQAQREAVLGRFRARRISVLVATDVAARGIDVADLTHVVNFTLPQSPDAFVHRTGRTGRAGKQGKTVTFITPYELRKLQFIRQMTGLRIKRARIPSVNEVIEAAKARIRERLEERQLVGASEPYRELTTELLEEKDAETLIASLLEQAFEGELDRSRYREITQFERQPKPKGSTRKRTKLFVTRGRRDGVTPKDVSTLISEVCDVPGRVIGDMTIRDRSGSLTLPAREAEVLLDELRSARGKPLITRFRENPTKGTGRFKHKHKAKGKGRGKPKGRAKSSSK